MLLVLTDFKIEQRLSVRGRNVIADVICYRRQDDVTWLPPTFPRLVRGKNRINIIFIFIYSFPIYNFNIHVLILVKLVTGTILLCSLYIVHTVNCNLQ